MLVSFLQVTSSLPLTGKNSGSAISFARTILARKDLEEFFSGGNNEKAEQFVRRMWGTCNATLANEKVVTIIHLLVVAATLIYYL